MDNQQIREIVKEIIEDIINTKQIKETDLITKSKSNWEETKKDLKDNISSLIKNLESDNYEDGLEMIDKAINGLKTWKNKINKNI